MVFHQADRRLGKAKRGPNCRTREMGEQTAATKLASVTADKTATEAAARGVGGYRAWCAKRDHQPLDNVKAVDKLENVLGQIGGDNPSW